MLFTSRSRLIYNLKYKFQFQHLLHTMKYFHVHNETACIHITSYIFSIFSIIDLKKDFSKSFFFYFFSLIFVHINLFFQPSILIKFNHSVNFFNTNLLLNACFNFLMGIRYSFLSCKLGRSFSTFSIFFQVKMVNHL